MRARGPLSPSRSCSPSLPVLSSSSRSPFFVLRFTFGVSFSRALERIERSSPELVEVVAKRVEPIGVELVDPVASVAPLAHDARLFEHAQMFGNGGPAHVEVVGELVDAVRLPEQVLEHRAPRRIGHGPERVCSCGKSVWRIGNPMVTYYAHGYA